MRIEPKEIIKTFKRLGSVREVGVELGIAKSTVYRWLTRARSPYPYGVPQYCEHGLKRKSTRPKHIHYDLSSDERVRIEAIRKKRVVGMYPGDTLDTFQYKLTLYLQYYNYHKRHRVLSMEGMTPMKEIQSYGQCLF
jgi:hypothetical protein